MLQEWCDARDWVDAMKVRMRDIWYTTPWPELDSRLFSFPYRMDDISNWPFDGVLISTTTTNICFLGSVKAAACLEEFPTTVGHSIDVVVSLCGDEMYDIQGLPFASWKEKLSGCQHVVAPAPDPVTDSLSQSAFALCASDQMQVWIKICKSLQHIQNSRKQPQTACKILFHCFGGINRSSAALCAWLIFAEHFSAENAIELLLKARPGLDPWYRRDHFLWALRSWETFCIAERSTVS